MVSDDGLWPFASWSFASGSLSDPLLLAAWNETLVNETFAQEGKALPTGHVQGYSPSPSPRPPAHTGGGLKRLATGASALTLPHLPQLIQDEQDQESVAEGECGLEEGDIVVPDMHSNVPEAVLLAHDKAYGSDSVLLRAGQHSWTTYNYGRIEVLRSLRVKAQRGAVLVGKWLLLEGSSGSMHSLRALSRTPSSQTERCMYDATLYWRDARGWRVVNCDMRSAGSIAVLVTRSSHVVFARCTMGGALERRYDEDFDELYCASEALTVLGSARVSLDRCRFQDSFGPACSLMGESVCRIRRSVFARCSIGSVFDWECRFARARALFPLLRARGASACSAEPHIHHQCSNALPGDGLGRLPSEAQ
jgi:hypothetical protein